MPQRALWKGVVSFGVVSVPVKLYSAVHEERVSFNLLHDQDQQRLFQRMFCPADQQPVEREQIVKGALVEEGEYVLVEQAEIDALSPESSREIDVLGFTPASDIDPRYFERAYYLGPDGDEANFALLLQALRQSGQAGLCRWVMRKRPYIGAMGAWGDGLSLVTLRWADEIIPPGIKLRAAKIDPRELKTAQYLVETLAADEFKPQQYHDEYEARVRDLIQRKAKGEKIELGRPRTKPATRETQLLDVLERSVKQAKEKRHAQVAAAR